MSEKRNLPQLRFPEYSSSWDKKKLGEKSKIFSGGTPSSGKAEYYGGKISFIRSGEIGARMTELTLSVKGLENSSAKMVDEGDLLLAIYGATSGEAAISQISGAINQAILCIRPDLDRYFLLNWLKRNKEIILATYLQGGQGNLSGEIVKSFEVFFPSLPEQQKIAEFLTAVDQRIELLQAKKEKLEAYKKGVMQKIFPSTGSGQVPQLRFKADDGSDFPDWEERRLGEVAEFRRGSFPQPYGLPEWYDEDNGMPFVQVFDVDSNMRLKDTTKQKISEAAMSKSVFVPKGTLVLTIQGSIGRIAITQYDCYVDRTLLIFTKLHKNIDLIYFAYSVERLFEIEKRSAPGGTIKTITKEVLTDFFLQIPALAEQQKIAKFLTNLDNSIENLNQQINQTQTWKKGLLQKMFV